MLKNVRFGPCSSSSGSHPAPWLWPPPGSGRASAWSYSPPPPSTWPWPSTCGGARGGSAGAALAWCWWRSCSGPGPTPPSWRHRPVGHQPLGRRQVRRPRAAPTGLVRVRGAVRQGPRVVGHRRNLALLAIHPAWCPAPAGQRRHPRPDPLVPAGGGRRPGRRGRGRPPVLAPLVYSGVVMWGSLVLMVVALVRASRVYRRVATVLIVTLVVPYVFNVLYNFDVGPPPGGRPDAVPAHRVLPGAGLGLFRFRLLGIRPVARGLVFETISEAVLILDPAPGGGRQPAGRAAPSTSPWPTRSATRWASCCRRRPRRSATRRRPATGCPGAGRDQEGGSAVRADGGGQARP